MTIEKKMFCGHWNTDLIRLMRLFVMLAGVNTETGSVDPKSSWPQKSQVRRPPPTFEITEKGNYLNFHGNPPKYINQSSHCWKYMFQYSKCKEKPITINVTEHDNWTVNVDYDSACKYTVQATAIYDTKYCGEVELHSDISKPMYFGEDSDPNLPFKVAMIIIPVIVCSCLIIAIMLFRRHKDKVFPQVPNPTHFFKDLFESNKEMTKGLYVRELYVPDEEVVEEIHVEPMTA